MFLLVGAIIHKQIIIIIRVNTSRRPGQIKNYLTECLKLQNCQYFMMYIYVQRELRRNFYEVYIRPEGADMEY